MRYSVVKIGDSGSMVVHKRLQQYKRYYGKTLMTGLYGCRWHRYQQSRDNTSIWDLAWFCALILIFLFTLMWLFYWVAAFNDDEYINELISEKLGRWYTWHTVLLAVSTATFGYVALLFLLGLFHTGYGHEMYMHKLHKGLLLLILTACITATNCATTWWPDGWMLIYLSILASWPFIHLVVVAVMTALTLVIAKRWMYMYTIGARVATLGVFVLVVVFIYVSPLLIQPPCVLSRLPDQPGIIAHRGGAALAPENTLLAFQLSNRYAQVIGFECDVRISMDGVPFLLRDLTLGRTTDVARRFPDRVAVPAHNFNMTDLQTLDAGSWFIENDPYSNADIPVLEPRIRNQTIPTFSEVLRFVKTTNKSLMIHIQAGPPANHPYAADYKEIILDTIIESGINPQKILWHYYNENIGNVSIKFRRTFTGFVAQSPFKLVNDSVRYVNLPYKSTDPMLFSDYRMNNISVNLYTVNSVWLYSLCWCTGITSVTTNQVHTLSSLHKPTWTMSPPMYLIMWVTTDIVSAIIIICIFVYNKVRNSGAIFNPETLSLQAMQHRISQTKQNRNMKEKLLHAAESIQDMENMNGVSGIITPSTPATPATIETPTTPLSPTTPNLTIHGGAGHHPGNICFSPASGFFSGKVAPVNTSGVGNDSEGGVYNEALSPRTGNESMNTSPQPNGAVPEDNNSMKPPEGLTENQVRGFFEASPLRTEHYRSLSENYTHDGPPGSEPRPRSDLFDGAKPPHHPNRNSHFRSNSATIPNTFFPEANGSGLIRKGLFAEARSASMNSDVIPRDSGLHGDYGSDPVTGHFGLNHHDGSQPGLHTDGLNHADISIEVS